jgi:hypothetical protein
MVAMDFYDIRFVEIICKLARENLPWFWAVSSSANIGRRGLRYYRVIQNFHPPQKGYAGV